jgi:3-polyprenyl-4-hydroxybenzoate decarboxylase
VVGKVKEGVKGEMVRRDAMVLLKEKTNLAIREHQ